MNHGRKRASAALLAGALMLAAPPVFAQSAPGAEPRITGLFLTTLYPDRSAEFGEPVNVSLSLENKALPPERVALSVTGLPAGWSAEIDGGGATVTSAMVATDDKASLNLKLTPQKDVKAGRYAFNVVGKADDRTLTLPITLTLAEPKPAKLTLEPKLPELRGTAKSSFEFETTLKNDSLKDTTVTLAAQAPEGFEVAFTEGYGAQEITSLPVKAGETKTIKAKVSPPQNIAAGQYPITLGAQSDVATATTPVAVDVTGQPKVTLVGPNGMLSGSATAGAERDFTFTLANTGTEDATDITVTASAPSGWKAEAEPKTIPVIRPDGRQDVAIRLTPASDAIAGDYMTTVSASGKGVSNSADFRVTVTTSTLWGATGLGVIAASLMVLAVGVRRYGRR